jgi:hypothetical protein
MFMALMLLLAAVLACSGSIGNETEKANKLVTEGNAAVDEAKKFVTEAEGKKARTLAKEAIAAYDKAEDKCKEAAKKYDEASKLRISDKFKEYLTLKVKEYNKRAEVVETAKATPQALIDSENQKSFITKANANNEKVDALGKEAEALASESEKLQKDNPDIFK